MHECWSESETVFGRAWANGEKPEHVLKRYIDLPETPEDAPLIINEIIGVYLDEFKYDTENFPTLDMIMFGVNQHNIEVVGAAAGLYIVYEKGWEITNEPEFDDMVRELSDSIWETVEANSERNARLYDHFGVDDFILEVLVSNGMCFSVEPGVQRIETEGMIPALRSFDAISATRPKAVGLFGDAQPSMFPELLEDDGYECMQADEDVVLLYTTGQGVRRHYLGE